MRPDRDRERALPLGPVEPHRDLPLSVPRHGQVLDRPDLLALEPELPERLHRRPELGDLDLPLGRRFQPRFRQKSLRLGVEGHLAGTLDRRAADRHGPGGPKTPPGWPPEDESAATPVQLSPHSGDNCAIIVGPMPIRAVIFDVGGVLERISPPLWADAWRRRLGLGEPEFEAALARVDPDDLVETGGISEAEMRNAYAEALGLSAAEADELMADVWDWYCGELDQQLVAYARSLRPRLATGILSNSADGARREEARRHRLPELVDDVVYSHEVGLAKPDPAIYELACERLGVEPAEAAFVNDVAANVEAANRLGLHGVLHRSTAATIAAVDALRGEP